MEVVQKVSDLSTDNVKVSAGDFSVTFVKCQQHGVYLHGNIKRKVSKKKPAYISVKGGTRGLS